MKVNKFLYEIVIQGSYGYGQGLEDVTVAKDWVEARSLKRDYVMNEPGIPFRIINRRVLNPAWVAGQGGYVKSHEGPGEFLRERAE